MADGILGNAVGAFGFPKTYIMTDSEGNELTGVYVESETIFTATDNDVREGMVYASDGGVSTGTKNIPSYRTTQGKQIIFAGEEFIIKLKQYDKYDYTRFQCIITPYNTTLNNSVAANKVSINDNVYLVNSTDILSNVTKDADLKSINLNLAIDNDIDYVIHYFTYKEEA